MKTTTARLAGHHYLHLPGSDPGAPPLLLLHGTGGTERDLVSLAQRLSPGSTLLSPRGNVSENGANRFFRRFAEGVFDYDDVRARTDALAEFISAACTQLDIAQNRLLAFGFSNGANIGATLLQRQPTALAGGILLRPMVVLDEPAAPDSLTGKSVLLANGTFDPIIPADHPERLAKLLAAGGATVQRHTSAASHNLTPADLEAATAFLESL
ncbi:alpha/beta hydrolase [Actomonas aquatica]|uniref:Alpha/beta hydrolase n=1 Tax=Actomonas aquatica TaxID=2866162 RepID=A0ABZ1CCU0_9BACT|nr:alpha/beta hydrolase [Opitutus sp. WL0086]WRQ89487.1 alpha/beta hydrolase [Opitutus sp. WL0086]